MDQMGKVGKMGKMDGHGEAWVGETKVDMVMICPSVLGRLGVSLQSLLWVRIVKGKTLKYLPERMGDLGHRNRCPNAIGDTQIWSVNPLAVLLDAHWYGEETRRDLVA